jgi:acetamidase/formamidase
MCTKKNVATMLLWQLGVESPMKPTPNCGKRKIYMSSHLRSLLFISIVGAAAFPLHAQSIKPDYHLRSIPENTVMFLSAEYPPVLKIKSGAIVQFDTLCIFGMSDDNPQQFFLDNGIPPESPIAQEMLALKKWTMAQPAQGTTMTGPVYVEGAMPGDTLEVRILDVKSRSNFGVSSGGGHTAITRLAEGGVPLDMNPGLVPGAYTKVVKLNLARNVAMFSPTIEVPLHQFQGRMAVAPTRERGKLTSAPPYPDLGSNLDDKYLGKGATIYFPVQVEGALFVTGDPHAVMGDGEVSGNALESSNTVTMQFILRKNMPIARIEAETPTHYIIMGMDKDLNGAAQEAVAHTLEFLQKRKGLDASDSLALSSIAIDFVNAEIVSSTKVVQSMIPKSLFKNRARDYWYHPHPTALPQSK